MNLLKHPISIALAVLWLFSIIMMATFVSPAVAAWITFATWAVLALCALLGFIIKHDPQFQRRLHHGGQ